MSIIGLTGRIGSGKSTISAIANSMGVYSIDADSVVRNLYSMKNEVIYREILSIFGHSAITNGADMNINRDYIRKVITTDHVKRQSLEKAIWPHVREIVEKNILQNQDKEVSLIEATRLFEAEWIDLIDVIWIVSADDNNTLHRLTKKGINKSEILAFMNIQMSLDKYISASRSSGKPYHLITNNDTIESLQHKVKQLLNMNLLQNYSVK